MNIKGIKSNDKRRSMRKLLVSWILLYGLASFGNASFSSDIEQNRDDKQTVDVEDYSDHVKKLMCISANEELSDRQRIAVNELIMKFRAKIREFDIDKKCKCKQGR